MSAFELRHVDKRYGDLTVFSDASAAFEQCCVHIILGPSGAGKTTLLRLLVGLEEPDAGEVLRSSSRFGMTFQEDRLCNNLSATANIRLVHPSMSGHEREAFIMRERTALAAVGLPVDTRPVREYSGGQRRRIALLRCVLADADMLLFDEPLKGMDENTITQVMDFVAPRLEGKTIFWVTHDERECGFFSQAQLWRVERGKIVPVESHGSSLC